MSYDRKCKQTPKQDNYDLLSFGTKALKKGSNHSLTRKIWFSTVGLKVYQNSVIIR